MSQLRRSAVLIAVGAFVLFTAPAAGAAPPPNDARAAPQPLGALPASVRGTTVEASVEADEPASSCAANGGSVWYAFDADEDRPVVVALDAAGDLDAVVELFARERSQLTPVACGTTNRRGASTLELDADGGTSYLIRVAALVNSARDRFDLRVVEPDRPARFPGPRLPRGGVNSAVDRIANADDAWSVRLLKGRTYRINFVSRLGCASVDLYVSEGADPARSLRCDQHTVYVPSASRTYTLLVRAPRGSRARLPYRLRVGPAEADDTAPGIRIGNDVATRGRLQGGELDAVDLYRFSLTRASRLRVSLRTGADFDLRLYRDSGSRLGGGGSEEIELRAGPGRYFIAVRARDGAAGRYVLRRLARTITNASTLVDGARSVTVSPGRAVALGLVVTPAVDGRADLTLERFDPLAGWLFHAAYRPVVIGGRASVSFRPPSVGRWRVSGGYRGTRRAAPSEGGTAHFTVEEPLED
jgi:Bacterial pre-peptidase C-terminal domain